MQVIVPCSATQMSFTREKWVDLSARFAAYAAWQDGLRGAAVAPLGIVRCANCSRTAAREDCCADRRGQELADVADSMNRWIGLVHYHQHLATLLNNFASLHDFYTPEKTAIFQAGTLSSMAAVVICACGSTMSAPTARCLV